VDALQECLASNWSICPEAEDSPHFRRPVALPCPEIDIPDPEPDGFGGEFQALLTEEEEALSCLAGALPKYESGDPGENTCEFHPETGGDFALSCRRYGPGRHRVRQLRGTEPQAPAQL
jgi:hypothetical protein